MVKKKSWMRALAKHYNQAKASYPDDKLMIVFDIGGTILDLRYMIVYILKWYDAEHQTKFFTNLQVHDINFNHNEIDKGLVQLHIPEYTRDHIISWVKPKFWSERAILEAHKPFAGVLEVMRWFQLQPNTFIGINSARSRQWKASTLQSLQHLGEEYRVHFPANLLYMSDTVNPDQTTQSKVKGLKYFQDLGYRIIAVIDNERENLKAIHNIDPEEKILLLHPATIFDSKRTKLPRLLEGRTYDLTELIEEHELPQHITMCWHGINDTPNLKQFLHSNILWGEVDLQTEPITGRLLCRHDTFEESPQEEDEHFLYFDDIVKQFTDHQRSLKIDFKTGGETIEQTLDFLAKLPYFTEQRLWFNANLEIIQKNGISAIKAKYPHAIMQIQINFMAPLVLSTPNTAKTVLDELVRWGVNQFAIDWGTKHKFSLLKQLKDEWGYRTNIYGIPDLEAFLKCALLHPHCITTDFNFPKWHYYGRGSGQGMKKHVYQGKAKKD